MVYRLPKLYRTGKNVANWVKQLARNTFRERRMCA